MNERNGETACPRNAEEAEASGWTVDRHTWPWRAYTGPCFTPDRCVLIATPAFDPTQTAGSVQR